MKSEECLKYKMLCAVFERWDNLGWSSWWLSVFCAGVDFECTSLLLVVMH